MAKKGHSVFLEESLLVDNAERGLFEDEVSSQPMEDEYDMLRAELIEDEYAF